MAMMFKARKRLRAFLLLLAFLICQTVLFSFPAYAFISSLDACAGNSTCSSALVSEMGLKASVKSAIVSSSPKTITVQGALFKSKTVEAVGGALGFLSGGALSYAYLSKQDVEMLQDKAMFEFCANNDVPLLCGERYILNFYNISASRRDEFEGVFHHEITSEQCGWRDDFRRVRIYLGGESDSFITQCTPPDSVSKGETESSPDWSDPLWDGSYLGYELSARDIAVEYLTDSDFVEVLNSEEILSGSELDGLNPNDDIIVSFDFTVAGTVESPFIQSGGLNTTPAEIASLDSGGSSGSTSGSGGSTSGSSNGSSTETVSLPETGTNITVTTTTKETTTVDPDTGEEKVVVEEFEETTVEEQEPIQMPLIDPIQPQAFEQKSWMQHGIEVLSTKFPFDMFGDLDFQEISADCPVYTFFQRDFELCVIKDFFAAFKIPAIIGFAIWSYQYI